MKPKMIVNPVSGQHKAYKTKASVIEYMKKRYALNDRDIFYTSKENHNLGASFFEECDSLVVAGGDGTLHYAINTIKNLGLDIPLAYLPTGTVNDFGNALKLPRSYEGFTRMLEKGATKKIDIGLAGEEYFHYVVAGGAMNSISYTTNQTLKNVIGDKAYYLSALPKLPKYYREHILRLNVTIQNKNMMHYSIWFQNQRLLAELRASFRVLKWMTVTFMCLSFKKNHGSIPCNFC